MCAPPLQFNITSEALAKVIWQKKRKLHVYIGNEEIKLSLFKDDMIIYIEISKESTKKAPRTSK